VNKTNINPNLWQKESFFLVEFVNVMLHRKSCSAVGAVLSLKRRQAFEAKFVSAWNDRCFLVLIIELFKTHFAGLLG
jgi:hypothetical protein